MKISNQVSDPDLLRQVTTFVAIIASIMVNTFSNFYPLNGVNIGDLSNTLFFAVKITHYSSNRRTIDCYNWLSTCSYVDSTQHSS